MTDLPFLTILLGLLGFLVLILLWLVGKLEKRVLDLERNTTKIEGKK